MPRKPDYEKMSVFERIEKGLEESLAYTRGELALRTTVYPAPPPMISARRVVALRKKLGMSQSVFAATLNVSIKLVQNWEQGLRKPDRGALRLLQIIEKRPKIVQDMFAPSHRRSPQRRKVA